ncbi:MAG: helix-turn-helix domain-containing protein [Bacillota bacterium]
MQQFYTVPEVAKALRVRKSYVYELIYQGRLKAFNLSQRRIRIPEESLREFVEKEIGQVSFPKYPQGD